VETPAAWPIARQRSWVAAQRAAGNGPAACIMHYEVGLCNSRYE